MSHKASTSARTLNTGVLILTSITILIVFPVVAAATGSFRSAVAYDAGAPCLNSIAVADVNADGKPDVVAPGGCPDINSQGLPGSVSVLLGNGDGTFQPAMVYDSGGVDTTSLQVADVNGDGKLDVLAASVCSTAACPIPVVAVLLGNGDGTFLPPVTYDSGLQAWSLAVADLNRDGKLDLVVAGSYVPGRPVRLIGILLGNGDGTFQSAVTYGSGPAVSVALSDVNDDDKLDALVTIMCSDAYCNSGLLGVLLGDGDGTFQPEQTYDANYEPTSLAIADLNGDGKADAVVTNQLTRGTLHSAVGVLLGNGDGTFGPVMSYDSGAPSAWSLAVGDVSLDGQPDLVVAHCTLGNSNGYGCPGGSGIVSVLLGNADGTFRAPVRYTSGGVWARSIVVSDVDGDGLPDLLVANRFGGPNGNGTLAVLLNRTTSTTLASSLNPSVYGQQITWTAKVTTLGPVAPTGNVAFRSSQNGSSFTLGTVPLNASRVATLTKSNLTATYPYPITAVYLGDALNLSSSSPVLTQVVKQTTSTATINSSPNPSTRGQAVTFTATITSPTVTVTGPVTFTAGTTILGTAQLSRGIATFTTSALPTGSTRIQVTYPWNSNVAKCSASLIQTVQ